MLNDESLELNIAFSRNKIASKSKCWIWQYAKKLTVQILLEFQWIQIHKIAKIKNMILNTLSRNVAQSVAINVFVSVKRFMK